MGRQVSTIDMRLLFCLIIFFAPKIILPCWFGGSKLDSTQATTPSTVSSHQKGPYQCKDAQNNVVTRCTTRIANCALGCDTEYTGWDCTNIKDKSNYVLTCPHGQSNGDQACINHLQHADHKCLPCCRVRD